MSDKNNKVDLKSVSGGKGQPSTSNTNVDKAKQIVKEELKKESLAGATGRGPLPVKVSGGASGEARPAHGAFKPVGGAIDATLPICTIPNKES